MYLHPWNGKEFNSQYNVLFLDTRRIRNAKYAKFHRPNYDICKANFNILSICESSSGELKNTTIAMCIKSGRGNL